MKHMKHITLLIAFVTIIFTARDTQAQQPNPLACNQMLDDLRPLIYERQIEYATLSGGHLFQGLATHSTPPTTSAPPDTASTHPTDQPISWVEFMGADLPTSMPCALQIDVYESSNGQGYALSASYQEPGRVAGGLCTMSDATGPEARRRKRDWKCE